MKRKEVLKEKTITNEYGVSKTYQLCKWYYVTKNGTEYNVEYIVKTEGYMRIYKTLKNALKDSYVEEYLKEEQ